MNDLLVLFASLFALGELVTLSMIGQYIYNRILNGHNESIRRERGEETFLGQIHGRIRYSTIVIVPGGFAGIVTAVYALMTVYLEIVGGLL